MYPHPLESQLPHLYNTLTGKIEFRAKITNEHDALMKTLSDELICNHGYLLCH